MRQGHRALRGWAVVTVLLSLLSVSLNTSYTSLSHTQAHTTGCAHTLKCTRSIDSPAQLQVIPPSGAGIKLREASPQSQTYSFVLSLQYEQRNAGDMRRVKIIFLLCFFFLSVVCMACRLELNKACVASGCRATGTIGRSREEWCQRNTQSDIGTARKICLRRWSQHPAWYIHAWYNG